MAVRERDHKLPLSYPLLGNPRSAVYLRAAALGAANTGSNPVGRFSTVCFCGSSIRLPGGEAPLPRSLGDYRCAHPLLQKVVPPHILELPGSSVVACVGPEP